MSDGPPQQPAVQQFLSRRRKYQLHRVQDASQPSQTLPDPQRSAPPQQTIKFGKTKLVRASPTLIAQLRQQAAERVAAHAVRPPARAAAAQPGTQRSAAAHKHTWTRIPQEQQRQPVSEVKTAPRSAGKPQAAAERDAATRAAPAATPPRPGSAPLRVRSSQKARTVSLPSSGGGDKQRVLIYQKGWGGKSLHRAAVKAAGARSLTWHNTASRPVDQGAVGVQPGGSAASPAQRQPAAAASAALVPTRGATAGLPQQNGRRWHKYVRVRSAAGTSPARIAAAAAATPAPGRGQQRRTSSSPRPLAGGGRLLRLGTAMYKARPRLPSFLAAYSSELKPAVVPKHLRM